ncbi:hypothetical protein ACHAWF_008950, partial [Thalassiosira exigua]
RNRASTCQPQPPKHRTTSCSTSTSNPSYLHTYLAHLAHIRTMAAVRRAIAQRIPAFRHAVPPRGWRSVQIGHGRAPQQLMAMAIAVNVNPTQWQTRSIGSTLNRENLRLENTTLLALGPTTRSFGRKASRMGHHIQNLDDMAHADSRKEAKQRREEKKKKSKKARLDSHKEKSTSDEDENSEDDATDDDFGQMEDESGNPLLPDPGTVKKKMMMVLASIERSFSAIRGGETTPEMFDTVRVSAYGGEKMLLKEVAQVVIEDSQRATINCFDPSLASDVRDAVRDMPGMNLNPYLQDNVSGVIIVPTPRPNEETRLELVKEIGRQGENAKQRVRNIRRKANDVVNKGKQGKLEGISKDDAFRVGKDLDSVTEEVLSFLKEMVESKQKSVMED